jgi:hypothetical protein
MPYSITHFLSYHKLYLIIGAVLLLLILLPTKEKLSAGTKKALYILAIIWLASFVFRVGTGSDITSMFQKEDNFYFEEEAKTSEIKGSPFNKYYSNDAGRQSQ